MIIGKGSQGSRVMRILERENYTRLHLLKVDYPMNDESTLRDAGCFFE